MNLISVINFCIIVATFTLGGLVLRTNPRRTTNQTYLLISLFSGLWVVFLGFAFLCTTTSFATDWIRGAHSVGATIPLLCDWLRLAIIHPDKKLKHLIRMNPYLLSATLLFCALSQTPLLIESATIPDRAAHPAMIPEAVLGPFYFLYGWFFILAFSVLTFRFMNSRRQATGMQQLELNFTCLGVLVSITLAILVSIVLPVLTGSSQTTQLSSLSVMALNLIIAYGIVTQRIMNMAYLFRLLTAYSLLLIYLALLYLAVWLPVSYLHHQTGFHIAFLPGLLASLVVAFSLAPAHGLMQRFANHLFIHQAPLDMDTVVQLTNQRLYSISTIEQLLIEFSQTISQTLGTDNVCVMLADNGVYSQKYPPPASPDLVRLARTDPLAQMLAKSGNMIVPAVLRRLNPTPTLAAACKTIEDHHFAAAIGIHSKESLEGIFLLGPKLNGYIYGSQEQHALQLLCNQLAVALNNARLYTQLQDSKIYNEILVDSLVSGVIAANHDGTLTVFNQEAQRITRLSSAATLTRPLSVLPSPLATLLQEALEQGTELINRDYFLPKEQGDPTPLRISSSVIYGHTGKRLGAFLVVTDLTTIRQLELQVRRTDRLASLGTLAAGMAHEIKNPLVSIKTFTQLLPERYDDSDFRETFSSLVGGEVKRIDSIVNQLLRFSRPSKPVLIPTSLHALLNNTLKLLHQQLRSKNIQLTTALTAAQDQINADGDQLSQAFVNFFLNAIESMNGQGTLTVTSALTAPSEPHPSWTNGTPTAALILITIHDTGEGIQAEDISHIFDPFFTTKAQGTGLGLSVAHGIIQEHGGLINVESEVTQGTTFTIAIPLLKEDRI